MRTFVLRFLGLIVRLLNRGCQFLNDILLLRDILLLIGDLLELLLKPLLLDLLGLRDGISVLPMRG